MLIAILLFFAVELLAPSFQSYVTDHPKLVWGVLITGFLAALVIGLWEFIKPKDQDEAPAALPTINIKNEIREARANAPLIPAQQMLAPPGDFIGRKSELQQLRDNLNNGVTITGVKGAGGIGKTALALKLAEELKPQFSDGQIYFDLKGVSLDKPGDEPNGARSAPMSPASVMQQVITFWHPQIALPDDEAALLRTYHAVLADKRVLLLFDNAKDAAQVVPLIPPRHCLMIVTSRLAVDLPNMFRLDLETLPPEDARKLVLKIAARLEGHADTVAELCGRLPLALRAAASAFAKSRTLTPEQFIERLRQKRLEFKDDLRNLSAAASLSLSYELLADDSLPDLQRAWRMLAVFPNSFDAVAAEAVWFGSDYLNELIANAARQGWCNRLRHFFRPQPMPTIPADARELTTERLDHLEQASLIEWDADKQRFRWHDLALEFAKTLLTGSEQHTASLRHAAHYCEVLNRANQFYLQGHEDVMRGLRLFDQERKHIETGQAWVAAQPPDDSVAVELCVEYPSAGGLMLMFRQPPHKRIAWLESQLAAARRLKQRQYESYALGDLGNAYQDLGEPRRAVEYHEQALPIAREIGDRRSEGAVLGNLAIAYADLGEMHRAIEHYEQQLAITREIGDQRDEGRALGNLGIAYHKLGETRRAIEFYEQRIAIVRKIGDRHLEGTALWNLSLSLDDLGERTQAIASAEASLKIKEEIEDSRAEQVRAKLAEWRGE